MWAVTHHCYILHAPCLFDYKLIGFICPQQTPFGTDKRGSCSAGIAAKRFGRAPGSGAGFCTVKKLPTQFKPVLPRTVCVTFLYEILHLGLCVSPHSCSTKPLLLDLLSLIPLEGDADFTSYQCRRTERKRNSSINPILTSRNTEQTGTYICCVHTA